jgi:RNA polymerase sigma-70 factor, ECF subfamily
LVHLYTPLLFAWARRCRETEHDAADLVQEVFAVLVQTLPAFRYDRSGKFRGWLRTLMMNKLRDRKRRQARSDKALDKLRHLVELSEAEAFWETDYRRAVARRALHLMQADFAPATWKACWETVAEGRAPAELARELGISENAVYIAKHRVLQRLRHEYPPRPPLQKSEIERRTSDLHADPQDFRHAQRTLRADRLLECDPSMHSMTR